MRQLLSILMLFLSVTAFGQKQKEVTFDFSNPSYLNLSGDGDINLNSSEFTKGQIKMSFDRLPNSFGVYYNNNNKDYNLQILRGGRVLLTGMNGQPFNRFLLLSVLLATFLLLTRKPVNGILIGVFGIAMAIIMSRV